MNPNNLNNKDQEELDKKLLTDEQFYVEYGYYPDQVEKDGGLGEDDWESEDNYN